MKKRILFTSIFLLITKVSMASIANVSNTFGFNETDATENIQNALDSPYDTIVINFTGKNWIVRPLFAKSNKVIIFEPGVILMAKQDEFKGERDALITITNASNITFLGYGAILRMRKEEYQNTSLYSHSEWRHAINIQAYLNQPVENIVIKGLHIEKSGGDGICVSGISGYPGSDPVQPRNVLIQDVVCDDNHRQGISLTGAIDIKIVNTILKDTKGTPPQAGIDLEPDWERLLNVNMTNCYFSNNRVTGIKMYLYRPAWRGPKTIGFTFNNCHVDSDNSIQGIALSIRNLQDIEGSDGLITFNDCSFRNKTIYNTIAFTDKSALKAKVILNRCFIEQTNPQGSVISLSTEDETIKDVITFGGVEFNNCIVNDRYDRNFMSFADDSRTGKGIRDLKATLTVNNPFGAKYDLGPVTQNIDVQVQENKSIPPTIILSQPLKYQQITKGENLTITAIASDTDVGTVDGSGIMKVIYEVQYADTKVYTIEGTQAPYTFTIPTTGWQNGIYLVKAIVVSNHLETKNIAVIPIEIIPSVVLSTITATKEHPNNALKLHPNPASHEVTIDLSGFKQESSVLVQMTDAIGKLFVSQQVQLDNGLKKINLPVHHLPQGLFFVRVQDSKTIKRAKLVITK